MASLIFPGGSPDALRQLHDCQRLGKRVVGASSIRNDPYREHYPDWAYLPFVSDPEFFPALKRLVIDKGVTELYTANPTVWSILSKSLSASVPGVQLAGSSPIDGVLWIHESSLRVARWLWQAKDGLDLGEGGKQRISYDIFGALVHHADRLPGMCDHLKLLALAEIFRHTVPGDVVEIGSWWGKSAFILLFLSRQYRTGAVLCVDPWMLEEAVQNIDVLDSMADEMHVDNAHSVFLMNLIPYAARDFNYLRLPSVQGAERYRYEKAIRSDEFGSTEFVKGISVLHIDGNHSEASVRADLDAWAPNLLPGAWVVFDDYRWGYGSGPKVVADEYISSAGNIETAFFIGGALFVRLPQ